MTLCPLPQTQPPGGQLHWLLMHCWPRQDSPQPPQFEASEVTSTQMPLQGKVPAGQAHLPETQIMPKVAAWEKKKA